jgi:hypothetical protein
MPKNQAWSAQHFKANCWYLDCWKEFCLKKEEAFKKSIDIVEGTVVGTAIADVDQGQGQEVQQEEDLSHLDKKEKKKAIAKK